MSVSFSERLRKIGAVSFSYPPAPPGGHLHGLIKPIVSSPKLCGILKEHLDYEKKHLYRYNWDSTVYLLSGLIRLQEEN